MRVVSCVLVLVGTAFSGRALAAGVEIADGVTLDGYMRIRNESFIRSDSWGSDDGNHGRMVLRLGIGVALDELWSFNCRLATGGSTTSTNQDMNALTEKAYFYVDRVFARFNSEKATFTAGRTPNPYTCAMTLWDSDYNPDGLVEQFRFGEGGTFALTLGQHVIRQISATDKSYGLTLFGLQPKLSLKAGETSLTAALAYYHFERATDVSTDPVGSAYAIADVYLSAALKLRGQPFNVWADAFTNVEADDHNSAFGVGVEYGKAARGAVKLSFCYLSVDRDALWIDLGDANFAGSLEGEDMHGCVIGISTGLAKGTTLGVTYYDKISRESDLREGQLELDLVMSF